jgi:hypothetical protein
MKRKTKQGSISQGVGNFIRQSANEIIWHLVVV